jgi:hypothetical protein
MQENSNSNFDSQYNISIRTKLLLMGLLLILNTIIRIPSIPHEKGYDSFFIHSLANSISNYGVAKWWINQASIFGLYPYSYASAVPFTLSGMSQLTGIKMELAILLFCIILGLFSIFASFLLAKVLFDDNFLYEFIFAAIFSLSAGILNLTTWEITTRSQILVFFPFILYLVFQIIKLKAKFFLLFIMTLTLLIATHHFFYLILFYSCLITICALFYNFIEKYKHIHHQKIRLRNNSLNYIYISIFIIIFITIFLNGTQMGLLDSGSKYSWILNIIVIAARNLGFVFPLSAGGLLYLTLKKDKLMKEWSILICLLPTIFFSFNETYGYLIIYMLCIWLGAVGFINLIKNQKRNSRVVSTTLIILLIFNVTFSSFFTHYRLGVGGGYNEWYMKEQTYQTGEWLKDNTNWDKKAVPSSIMNGDCYRIYAVSGGHPILFLDDINNYINGFIKLNENNIEKVPMTSMKFYSDNPYVLKSGTTSVGAYTWLSYFPVTSHDTQEFLAVSNISYFLQDTNDLNTPLYMSLPESKNSIYNSGRMIIWTM